MQYLTVTRDTFLKNFTVKAGYWYIFSTAYFEEINKDFSPFDIFIEFLLKISLKGSKLYFQRILNISSYFRPIFQIKLPLCKRKVKGIIKHSERDFKRQEFWQYFWPFGKIKENNKKEQICIYKKKCKFVTKMVEKLNWKSKIKRIKFNVDKNSVQKMNFCTLNNLIKEMLTRVLLYLHVHQLNWLFKKIFSYHFWFIWLILQFTIMRFYHIT